MTIEEVDKIMADLKLKGYKPIRLDLAFALLRDIVGIEAAGYLLYRAPLKRPTEYASSGKSIYIKKIFKGMGLIGERKQVAKSPAVPAGQSTDNGDFSKENLIKDVTREQNKNELLSLIKKAQKAAEDGLLDIKDALTMEKDIRVKLQDKFDMEQSEDERRILIVPQKHDIVCPHTHFECTYMPTKEACMKYYDLKEA